MGSETSIYFYWSSVADGVGTGGIITGYELQIDDQGQGNYETIYYGVGQPIRLFYLAQNLISGSTYNARVRTYNFNGYGNWKTLQEIEVCGSPSGFSQPVITETTQTAITVQWTAPSSNGGCSVTGYAVFIDDGSLGSFVEANSDSDSLVRSIPSLNTLQITRIPADSLGKRFRIYVEVFNTVGSTTSPIVSTILATVPLAPPIPVFVQSLSSDTQLTIDISGFTTSYNGGSSVISFEIQMATGCSGPFVSLVGYTSNYNAQSYTHSDGVVKGTTYKFRYRAKNVHGFGDFSPELEVLAATVPSSPPRPTLSLVSSTSISLTFTATTDNGGSSITSYELWVDRGTPGTTYLADTAYDYSVDGFSVTLDVLTEGFTVGRFYRFKYLARNAIGPSELSNPLAVPLADTPTIVPTSLALYHVSKTSIQALWTAASSTGTPAGDIRGYEVYRDDGLSGDFSKIYGANVNTVRSLISTSLTTGNYYRFKYRAYNYAGFSLYSNTVGIYACIEPSGMIRPTAIFITKASINVKWVVPSDNGGCDIAEYEIHATHVPSSGSTVLYDEVFTVDSTVRTKTIDTFPSTIVGDKLNIQVKAKNIAELYGSSPTLSLTVASVPSQPASAPSEDTSTTTNQIIGVTYTEPTTNGAPILSYEVQIDDGNDGEYTTFAGGSSSYYTSLSAATDIGVVEGNTYRVRYRAKNVIGWGSYSNVAYILAASPPGPPTKPLYVTSTDSSITLGLSPSVVNNGAEISEHRLYMDEGSTSSDFDIVTGYNGVDTSYTASGLDLGLTYRFYYTAYNSKGESEASGEARYTVGSPPSASNDLSVSSSTTSSITLVWTKDTSSSLPITGYAVEINDGTDTPSGRALSASSVTGIWLEVYNGRGYPDITTVTISDLQPGVLYRFRYRSFDINGPSDYSSMSEFFSCDESSEPGTPVVTSNTLSTMTVSWAAPEEEGGCDITEYALFRNDGAGGSTKTQIHSTELAGRPEITKLVVSELGTSPLSKTFKFRVEVFTTLSSDIGITSSDSNEYLLAIVPDAPTVAPSKGSNTNAKQIEIVIELVTNTNGADILSYHIQKDDGDGGFFSEVSGFSSNDLTTTRLITSGITTGKLYRVRYRANNAKGFSPYSPIGYIEASQVPDKPSAPSLVVVDANVKISWSFPYPQGNSVKNTDVYIKNSGGVMTLHSNVATVTTLNVAMSDMISVYGLTRGDEIVAAIVVYNDNGASEQSSESTNNPTVQEEPLAPQTAPYSAYEALAFGNPDYGTRMIVKVDELSGDNTGGATIISYQVEYSSDGSTWTILGGDITDSLVIKYTVTGLTNGATYLTRYRAKNVHGWGSYSASGQILVSEVPQAVAVAPTTADSSADVLISWNSPTGDGGSEITGYLVQIKNSDGITYSQFPECATAISDPQS
jgi:large repetitive protein